MSAQYVKHRRVSIVLINI